MKVRPTVAISTVEQVFLPGLVYEIDTAEAGRWITAGIAIEWRDEITPTATPGKPAPTRTTKGKGRSMPVEEL